jgi:type IX secretion system PorP/SprF family membrane protein
MMKKIVGICLLGLGVNALMAQDIHFVQSNMTPQLLNPAAAGVFDGWERVSVSHRQQWITIGSPYITSQFSADMNFGRQQGNKQKAYMGLGINFFNDIAGDAKMGTNQFSINLSGVVTVVEHHTFSGGIQIGGGQRSAQLNNLTWGNQFDGTGFDQSISPNETNSATSFFYPDLGAGIYYNFDNITSTLSRKELQRIYFGVSYFHLNSPRLRYYNGSADQLAKKLVVMGGAELDIPNSKFVVAPSFAYFFQDPSQEILATVLGKYRIKEGTKYTGIYNNVYFTFGLSYRNRDAVAPTFGLEAGSIKVMASYEFNVSRLQMTTRNQGGFELAFQWHNFQNALFQGRRMKGYKKTGGK